MAENLQDFKRILERVKKLRKGDLVLVVWEDAKAFREDPYAEIVDVGFILDLVKGKLIITSEKGLTEHYKVAIPIGCIKEIRKVKIIDDDFNKMSIEEVGKDFAFKSLVSDLPLNGFLLKIREIYHVKGNR
ncbi:hypothetical protein CW703_07365 [Candidatus Bathyarchaeota archaeon]|nr:MAG: hypothetical protein CW703_07365 [Candidatus Bathyarchaeota archaeon]